MRCCIISFLLLFTVIGCSSSKKPRHLLAEKKYVNTLIELRLLHTHQEQQKLKNTTVDSLRTLIFKKYGTTQDQFLKSHVYYQQNLDQQSERINQAIENLRKDHISKQDSTSEKDSTKTNT